MDGSRASSWGSLGSQSWTLDELGQAMLLLDHQITEAAREHRWLDAQDLDRVREDVMYLRMGFLRKQWLDKQLHGCSCLTS